jgi:hypothetical protein
MDPLLSNLDMANGGIVISKGEGIYANGSYGSNGQVLVSNGTSASWGTVANITAKQYYLASF